MKRVTVCLTALALCALGSAAYAVYSVGHEGKWPTSWPKEMEPLRKQAITMVGPMTANRHYAIPFTEREAFEAAWPHILKVRTKGTPLFLVHGPNFFLGEHSKAGVVVHCPSEDQKRIRLLLKRRWLVSPIPENAGFIPITLSWWWMETSLI